MRINCRQLLKNRNTVFSGRIPQSGMEIPIHQNVQNWKYREALHSNVLECHR
jgi:hypothetical protein